LIINKLKVGLQGVVIPNPKGWDTIPIFYWDYQMSEVERVSYLTFDSLSNGQSDIYGIGYARLGVRIIYFQKWHYEL